MKKTLLMLMLASMLAFTARAQVLQNTWWRSYTLTNVASEYWHFGQDTIGQSITGNGEIKISTYTTNSNLFTIIDLPFNWCPVTDTGKYNFLIQSDTLRFNIISDPCNYRQGVFSFYYFVRSYLGIEDLNSISTATIYPNPSTDGIFNLKFNDYNNLPQRIYVMSADGRKIMKETFSTAATNHTLNLQPFASGIYFLVMENEKGSRVVKLVK
ncbi:MAG: T9SS type A sorting domain-containing protein [Bacteroidia bacterium]|nr:T9SS type A sorting domain-containing protein [Bacteroidia bacterium]